MNNILPCDSPPIRVLGIGSDNGADQLGFLAARQLETSGFAARYTACPVDIAICPSPALLAARYSPARALILIDAWRSGQPAGTVRHFSLDDIGSQQTPASSHGIDLKQALEICCSLQTGTLPVSIIGISTGPDTCQRDIQPPFDILETCFPALQEAINRDIIKMSDSVH